MLLLLLLFVQFLMVRAAVVQARTIAWSGYTWDVRPTSGPQAPGPNDWADSAANVQVQGSELLLSIVQDSSGNWTSAEVDNEQHLGYGTYRWVVDTDLSALDGNEVLGMFTYGGSAPSNNEIDIEPSHWGDLTWPTGSVTVWQNAATGQSIEQAFSYSSHPPYVNEFTWSPGRIDFLITDATGATLFRSTIASGVPTPSTEVPVINYWRYNNVAPAGVRTMRVASFAWAPLGVALPPAGTGGTPAAGPGAGGPGSAPGTSAQAHTAPRPPPRAAPHDTCWHACSPVSPGGAATGGTRRCG